MANEETAYDVLRPFLTLINLYGVNWKSERNIGWRVAKFKSATWWTITFAVWFKSYKNTTHDVTICHTVTSLTFFTCLILWREMDDLVGQLKTSRVDQTSMKMQIVKRWAKVFSFYLYLFATCVALIVTNMAVNESWYPLKVRVIGIIMGLSMSMYLLFAFLVPFFFCFLALYISATIDDHVQRVKSCKSPLRRGKEFTKLMTSYTQLSRMTKTADQLESKVMYFYKVIATMMFLSGSIDAVRELLGFPNVFLIYLTSLQFGYGLTLILLYYWYVRLASSVNSKVSYLMFQLVGVWQMDDQWLSRDPASRCHLLEMRLNQLIELRHVMIVKRASLTFIGEPIDGESLFTLCAEMVDTANAMYTKASKLPY